MNRSLQRFLPFLISAIAAALFLHLALPQLAAVAQGFRPGAAAVIALIVVAVQILHALKLRLLLPGAPPLSRLLGVCLVSNFFGAVFFTQLAADVSKFWILNRSGAPGGENAIAVLRDRASSVVAVAIALSWALFAPSVTTPAHFALLPALVLAAALFYPTCEAVVVRLATALLERLPPASRLRPAISALPRSAPSLHLTRWLGIHGFSLLIQLTGATAIGYSFHTLGTAPTLSHCVLLACVSALAVVLPLTAGGLGVREITSYSLLIHWGYPESAAVCGLAQLTAGFLGGAAFGALLGWALLRWRPLPEFPSALDSESALH